MANYKGKYLNQTKKFIENSSFDMDFVVYDSYNDILANDDLADFQFYCYITDGGNEIIKQDVNYDDGAATQISVSGKIVTVHILEEETEGFDGNYWVQLQMVHKANGNDYTLYKRLINVEDTETD